MMQLKKYSGVIVPMITPFTRNGRIDHEAVQRIAGFLVDQGTQPFILGTTGESASIAEEDKLDFATVLVRSVSGKTITYAGISGTCLHTSVEAAKRYFDLGIDVAVAHAPGFYPLTDVQIQRYFEDLVEQIPGPLILYNIPTVTGMSLPLHVAEELSKHPRIVGLKDSERDRQRLHESIRRWSDREDFSHLIGWAAVSAEGLIMGSDGIVPSTGNIIPGMFKDLYDAAVSGDKHKALQLQDLTDRFAVVYQQNFSLGESLAALKVMMKEMALCEPHMLLPLSRLSAVQEEHIRSQARELVKSGRKEP